MSVGSRGDREDLVGILEKSLSPFIAHSPSQTSKFIFKMLSATYVIQKKKKAKDFVSQTPLPQLVDQVPALYCFYD